MEWSFHEDAPIYLQIIHQMKAQIATGALAPGDKIPPVRELAMEAGVNPNTMQKALSELEREGILYSKRTAGRFVAERTDQQETLQNALVKEKLETFLRDMNTLGYTDEEVEELLRRYVNGKQ